MWIFHNYLITTTWGERIDLWGVEFGKIATGQIVTRREYRGYFEEGYIGPV